jgi:serine/threonine protein kinase
MPPEAIVDGIFTHKSDVWSYGVVMWEIFSLGNQPYMGLDNRSVVDYIKNGGCLEVTEKCPERIRKLMSECWMMDREKRPNFEMILKDLTEISNHNDLLDKYSSNIFLIEIFCLIIKLIFS